ncbi:MAG TPA: FAD-dependent monooxygenase [Sphingobium sp.]|uniref:NAD(P)/FAD-dependent oxidoreductase n=1 Tax=Sphingobium sp. TaxID=1912891 RepID=UPI002ED6592C
MALSLPLLRVALAAMTDVLIVGGGLAGSAAATWFARQGRSVHLLERHGDAVHKICGEFLSIEAQEHLVSLGIDLDTLGASSVDRLRLVGGGRAVETRLPFVARGLSRMVLDEALLDGAVKAGAVVERPVRVLGVGEGGVRTDRGDRTGRALMLATGKLGIREEAAQPRAASGVPSRDTLHNAHVGFKMHWRLLPRDRDGLRGLIELTLLPGGYAGLQMVENDIANLCLVLRRDRLMAMGGRWEDVLASIGGLSPGLRALADAQPLFVRPVTIANLPYGHMHDAGAGEGIWRLGDQAAMTASLTGDGMAIALRSAWLAAQCTAAGLGPDAYHARLRAMVGRQMRRGMMLQRLVEVPLLPAAVMGMLQACPGLLRTMVRITRLPDLGGMEKILA